MATKAKTNQVFFNSIVFKQLSTNAPDALVDKFGINLEALEAEIAKFKEAGYCDNGWLNIDRWVGRNNKAYATVDTGAWRNKPKQGKLDIVAEKETLTTHKEAILKAE